MSGRIIFDVPSLGDVSIPITPTSMDGMVIGASVPAAGTFTSVSVSQMAASSVSVQGVAGVQESWAPSIGIPATTGSLAAAVALTAANNVVVSCTFTSGSPVALPTVASWLGGEISVFNQTTMTVGVWPQANDIIDGHATGTVALLDAGKRCAFFAIATTSIISAQLGVTSA